MTYNVFSGTLNPTHSRGRYFDKFDKTGSPEVVFSSQALVDKSLCCIKVIWEVGCQFTCVVSAIFLLPVWV